VNEVGRACGMHGKGEKSVKGLVGKPKGKRLIRRPKCRWADGITLDLREIGLGGL
jgi:hypothetical protein